jgi:hypothetical protein
VIDAVPILTATERPDRSILATRLSDDAQKTTEVRS